MGDQRTRFYLRRGSTAAVSILNPDGGFHPRRWLDEFRLRIAIEVLKTLEAGGVPPC